MSINLALKFTVVCVAILAAYLYMTDFSQVQDLTDCVNINTVEHIVFSKHIKINNSTTMKCRNGCKHDDFLQSIGCLNMGQNINFPSNSFPYWKCTGIMYSELYMENVIIRCGSCMMGDRYVHKNTCYIQYDIGTDSSKNENGIYVYDGDAFVVTPSEAYSAQENFLSVLLVAGMGFFTFFSMAFLRNRNIEHRP
ncbi:MAG: hypothetical protein Terrestrivirus6_70 [Terrestrivirus sp.]|uniref:Transmembrane protein n=1 Tax=Terrestrivirus sp. TaxID=2487775 RepID=A0A3G4ZQ44_9VIRU|nr:MAG: hypothetical protein Terrestrivirus6_70 [Terrestrivirus sp.]